MLEQGFQFFGHRQHGQLGDNLALGPAQVRHENDGGALVQAVPDSWQRRLNAKIIINYPAIQRNVEIHAHKDSLIPKAQLLDSFHGIIRSIYKLLLFQRCRYR